jgi:PAS domain S-box-containing protein
MSVFSLTFPYVSVTFQYVTDLIFVFDPVLLFITRGHQMTDSSRTYQELLEENSLLNQRIQNLEQLIFDLRKAEEPLRERELKYRLAFESTSDGIFTVDRNFIISNITPSVERQLGYKVEEVINRPIQDLNILTSESLARATVDVIKVLSGVEVAGAVYEFIAKDGTRKIGEVTGTPIIREGEIFGVTAIVRDITERILAEKQLQDTLQSLRKAFGDTIQVMVSAIESRDPYTAGHQTRSADLARAIATEMGLPREQIDGIRMAGSIHDIGKLSIPAEILSKPTKLTALEFSLIKEHSLKGYEMLKNLESQWPLAQIVYQHHERMDGSGYPRNLKGDDILIEARILAVADVVESMASHRPYRPALGIEAALEEIEKNSETLYDAGAVNACLRLFRETGFNLQGHDF